MEKASSEARSDWERRLGELLPLFGHRNWIVVADSAYPAQAKSGIETVVAGADHLDTVRTVLNGITACKHIRANIYSDVELDFVSERDAPGISIYRQQLGELVGGSCRRQVLHEEIIAKLDQSAQLFRVLIVKTDMAIPYTSVFFELDCGYWNAEAEKGLRRAMKVSEAR
jgi:hypothetical protein